MRPQMDNIPHCRICNLNQLELWYHCKGRNTKIGSPQYRLHDSLAFVLLFRLSTENHPLQAKIEAERATGESGAL